MRNISQHKIFVLLQSQDDEGFQSMVKEMTETQKVAAINAYQKSLMMGQTQTVSQSQVL